MKGMKIMDRRQISDHEKEVILRQYGRVCFIDGAPISHDEVVEFHHILPYSKQGATHIDNIAPVCKSHHRTIGTMTLQEYKDKLRIEEFFESGEPRYLSDLIQAKHNRYGEKLKIKIEDEQILLFMHSRQYQYPLYRCPITHWQYFYAMIPVEFIENDSELQPRALRPKSLWDLYRHFQTNTQLAPSICRVTEEGRLLLFDGQHKAAAQIWSGRKDIECKIYLYPDSRRLKETNLEAHGKFIQMSFYSHELIKKYADIFGEDWNNYIEDVDGEKSEAGFVNYLVNVKNKTKQNAKNEIMKAIYNDIVDAEDNILASFLPEKSRSREHPLTFSRLEKTMLKTMLFPPPVSDEFESDTDFRKIERRNLIRLMNIIAEEGLTNKWNPERKDALHHRTERIFSAGAVRAWTGIIRETINQHLRHYTEAERQRFFYRNIDDSEFDYFRHFVKRLFSHKLWDAPDTTGQIAARLAKDDATTAIGLFNEQGLTVQWLLGN
jgi:hypothetical protein